MELYNTVELENHRNVKKNNPSSSDSINLTQFDKSTTIINSMSPQFWSTIAVQNTGCFVDKSPFIAPGIAEIVINE